MRRTLEGSVGKVDQAPSPVVAVAYTVAATGAIAIEQCQDSWQIGSNLIKIGVIRHYLLSLLIMEANNEIDIQQGQ